MSSIDVRIGTTKVKTGCLVCRSRRIKCDEEWELGFCQRCSKSGRKCTGPPLSPVRYIHYSTHHSVSGPYDAHTTRSRQTAAVLSPSSLSDSCIDPFGTLPVDCQYALENCRCHIVKLHVSPSDAAVSISNSLLENGADRKGVIHPICLQ